MAGRFPGFWAELFAVLGNFSFQKLAMVKDLENQRAELLASDVVAAIAGDTLARRKLGSCSDRDRSSCLGLPFCQITNLRLSEQIMRPGDAPIL